MYATYDPNASVADPKDRWSPINTFALGAGFEYANSPTVTLRRYNGVGAPASGLSNGQAMLEMTFVGKLRGRANSEVFFGRVLCDDNAVPMGATNNPRFSNLPLKVQEILSSTDTPGTYRADGVAWNIRNTIRLEQVLNGVTTNLEVVDGGGNPTTRVYDQATGLITFDTKLGGKVYIDPGAGTVRFASVVPSNKAVLQLTYQPKFLRVSGPGKNTGHSAPTGLFDNRLVSETSYWVGLQPTDGIARYAFTYVKSSPGGGQTARPYLRTMRLGVQLPYSIATQPNGFVTNVNVTGNLGAYQVDPSTGRIYFTSADENNTVRISATLVLPDKSTTLYQVDSLVTFCVEREESPILIEQAINESGVYSFLDPFDPNGAYNTRRPGLIWLFWTSTRAGSPDIYFETIAPRFTPVPPGN